MRALIEDVFLQDAPDVSAAEVGPRAMDDGAALWIGDRWLVVTTDSHVVHPIFFPGGDIGRLSVCGTVNDLAMMGATEVARPDLRRDPGGGIPARGSGARAGLDGRRLPGGRRADHDGRHQGDGPRRDRRDRAQHDRRRGDRPHRPRLRPAPRRPHPRDRLRRRSRPRHHGGPPRAQARRGPAFRRGPDQRLDPRRARSRRPGRRRHEGPDARRALLARSTRWRGRAASASCSKRRRSPSRMPSEPRESSSASTR